MRFTLAVLLLLTFASAVSAQQASRVTVAEICLKVIGGPLTNTPRCRPPSG
jgi:hypothetical protein